MTSPQTKPQPQTIIALLASTVGLAISIYLTANHYAAAPLVCNLSGFSCERVLTSPYATLPLIGLPTSAAGIVFFAVNDFLLAMLGLSQFTRKPSARLSSLALAWAGGGVLFVLGLVYIEIVVLGAVCLWCTAAHILTVANLLLLLYMRFSPPTSA